MFKSKFEFNVFIASGASPYEYACVILSNPCPSICTYVSLYTDINFTTNEKTDIYDYLKENIHTDKIYKYEINSFEEFKDKFYKTDHHWNYKGSYLAYTELGYSLEKAIFVPLNPTIHKQ